MAKSKKPAIDADDEPASKETASKKKIHAEALKNYKLDLEADRKNRDGYREDMKFTLEPGNQWIQADKDARGNDRAMYEFNETRVKCKTEINQIRSNRPQAKISGTEEGDKEIAEIKSGLFLNIWNDSDGDSVTDYAAIHQVVGGMGAVRIDTEYADDSVDQQNIKINPMINPMCVLFDRNAKDELKRTARHCFVFSKMPNDDYEAKYPKADRVSFEVEDDLNDDLNDEECTWVAEYWKKVPVTRHLCLLSNGKTIDKNDEKNPPLAEGVTVMKERKVNAFKIVQYIISGDSILEGPNDWGNARGGKYLPFVPVFGEYMVVDGKVVWYGLPRFGKDAQRAHNWALTSVIETIASAPQAKFWATPDQAKGHTAAWAEANKKNFPFMLHNVDPKQPGPPQRMGGADVPVALMQAAQLSATALNNTMGVYEANEGKSSNETSGRAIRARQQAGQVVNYNFGDNMAKAHKRIAEIVLDLMPAIIDTPRALRILGKDGSEKYVRVNEPDPITGAITNDLSQGKLDIVVTTGPSYATQRQEAAEFYTEFSRSNPAVAAAAGDLIIKAQDYPMSDAIAERVRMLLPPQIQQQLSKDKPLPPEAQAALMQAEQAMQQVQLLGQQVQEESQKAQADKSQADKANNDVKLQVAQLKIEEANLATQVANFKVFIAQTELRLAESGAAEESANEKATHAAQLENALGHITQQASQLYSEYATQLAQMHGQAMAQTPAPPPPNPRVVKIKKVNGEFIPEYDSAAGGQRMAKIKKVNGEFIPEYAEGIQ